MTKLSVLMTVYNEADFVEYAIRACLPHVDDLVIVEGAYQETIALGASPRSTDGTIKKVKDLTVVRPDSSEDHLKNAMKIVRYIEANEQTDKDQRNIGLKEIKKRNPDGWVLIIDGDEVYDKNAFSMIKVAMHNMDKSNKLAAYFRSLTFVNDMEHFAEQDFPRLFKITPECKFIDDNFMTWPDKSTGWFSPAIIKIPYIRYHHYAFCKGNGERFKLKKDWWESRFGDNYMNTGKKFEYDWYVDKNGKIYSPNHDIVLYTGKHPEIMKDHPLCQEDYLETK